MSIFVVINLIKLVIGTIIVYLTCNYVNLTQDFMIWVFSMGLGIFILIWSVSFFLLLGILKLIYKDTEKKLPLIAYKYTALFAMFVITNFFLMSFEFWNKIIGFLLLFMFVLLGLII